MRGAKKASGKGLKKLSLSLLLPWALIGDKRAVELGLKNASPLKWTNDSWQGTASKGCCCFCPHSTELFVPHKKAINAALVSFSTSN